MDNVFDKQRGAVARMPESHSFRAQFLKSWSVKSVQEWATATVPLIFLAPDFSFRLLFHCLQQFLPKLTSSRVESLILMSQKSSQGQGPCTVLTWHDALLLRRIMDFWGVVCVSEAHWSHWSEERVEQPRNYQGVIDGIRFHSKTSDARYSARAALHALLNLQVFQRKCMANHQCFRKHWCPLPSFAHLLLVSGPLAMKLTCRTQSVA